MCFNNCVTTVGNVRGESVPVAVAAAGGAGEGATAGRAPSQGQDSGLEAR